jgi:hypothetical protein
MTKAKNRSKRQTEYVKTGTIIIGKPVPGVNAKITKTVKNRKASEKEEGKKMDRKEFEEKNPEVLQSASLEQESGLKEPGPYVNEVLNTYVDPFRAPEERENWYVLIHKNIHLFTREEFQSIITLMENKFDVTLQINNGRLINLEARKEFHGLPNIHINIYESKTSNG